MVKKEVFEWLSTHIEL